MLFASISKLFVYFDNAWLVWSFLFGTTGENAGDVGKRAARDSNRNLISAPQFLPVSCSSSQGLDCWISTAGLMTWSQHMQSPFSMEWRRIIIFHSQYCLALFLPYKEICIKQVCCWENEVFHVSCWWESKIFLSLCSLTLYAPLCGSVLFPAASPYCKGCSWLLPWARGRVAVGQEELGLCHSGIWPGLQLCCRRACVSLGPVSYLSVFYGCLCSIWSDSGSLNCSTWIWWFAVSFKENSLLRRK